MATKIKTLDLNMDEVTVLLALLRQSVKLSSDDVFDGNVQNYLYFKTRVDKAPVITLPEPAAVDETATPPA